MSPARRATTGRRSSTKVSPLPKGLWLRLDREPGHHIVRARTDLTAEVYEPLRVGGRGRVNAGQDEERRAANLLPAGDVVRQRVADHQDSGGVDDARPALRHLEDPAMR